MLIFWSESCRRCQLVPEEHEQHDQLPDQQIRMKKFEEQQQSMEEDRPPDELVSPSENQVNGTANLESKEPKCRQSSCKCEVCCVGFQGMDVVEM